MDQDTVILVIFLIVVGGSLLSVYLLSLRRPTIKEYPVEGYLLIDTLSSKGLVEIYVSDVECFRGRLECGFPTLDRVKTYIETGDGDRMTCNGNFFINIHVWVGICKGDIDYIDGEWYYGGDWQGYHIKYVRDYLKEVYDYNNLGVVDEH